MYDLFIYMLVISTEFAFYWFIYQWRKEVIVWVYMLCVGVVVFIATIKLILSFGTYNSVIRYRLPFSGDDEIKELRIRIP